MMRRTMSKDEENASPLDDGNISICKQYKGQYECFCVQQCRGEFHLHVFCWILLQGFLVVESVLHLAAAQSV